MTARDLINQKFPRIPEVHGSNGTTSLLLFHMPVNRDDYSVRTIKPIGIRQELTCTKPSDNNNEGI